MEKGVMEKLPGVTNVQSKENTNIKKEMQENITLSPFISKKRLMNNDIKIHKSKNMYVKTLYLENDTSH